MTLHTLDTGLELFELDWTWKPPSYSLASRPENTMQAVKEEKQLIIVLLSWGTYDNWDGKISTKGEIKGTHILVVTNC